MTNRGKQFCSFVCASLTLGLTGCGFNQQSALQSFLPNTPRPSLVAEYTPPVVQPDLHSHEMPAFLIQAQKIILASPGALKADSLMRRADQAYQRGRKLYQEKEEQQARKEFDTAIDLMLEASASNPQDRQTFEARLDEMVDAIHRYDLAGLGAGVDVEEARFDKAPLEDILEMTFPVDPNLKDRVKEQVQATASQLPLSVNDAVLGYINYFSGRGHKTLLTGLERAGRYRPMIQRVLQEEGIPQELIHLAQAESGFLPRAVSHKAAAGMWQFVAWRGNQYGLRQNRYSDDRLDPERATRASARHLHDLYNTFGDWYLAIAAYNCGPGVVDRAVERSGYADFWELRKRNLLPAETTNYVPIILAMTIMAKNAPEYGLEGVVADAPIEYDSIELTSPTHLALIADLSDAPLSELFELNPALLRGLAPAGYEVHVPRGTGRALVASLQLIPAERRASWRVHTVASGDTLASIGRRYGMSANTIAAANPLWAASPETGQRLVIPASERADNVSRRTVSKRISTAPATKKSYQPLTNITHTASVRVPRSAGAE